MNKILILLLYYERPNLIRNALKSVLRANEHYHNWFLVVHDDGSKTPAAPIVQQVMAPAIDRVGIIRTEMTIQEKVDSGGLLGKQLNDIIQAALWDVNPDVILMLCDDDELHPLYLKNLDKFFTENTKATSCYSKVICFDPLKESTTDLAIREDHPMAIKLNRWEVPMNGCSRVDASQVAWRADCHRAGAWFQYPSVKDQDAYFFQSLYEHCGPMMPTDFFGQYKGVHEKQLGVVGAWKAWTEGNIDK